MILVTGGTGFIGKILISQLTELGYPVRTLVRPSPRTPDLPRKVPVEIAVTSLAAARGLRAALVGATMPPDRLIGAMSIQRTTQDSARIAGALTGAGLVALLGMGPAYAVVVTFYATSVLLTCKAGSSRPLHHAARDGSGESARPRDTLANGQVREAGATTRSPQTAGSAGNESARPSPWRDLRDGLRCVWDTPHPAAGIAVLILTGIAQSMGLIPMTAMLLRNSDVRYRGRVMGIRMLVLYGNLPGLLISAPLIARIGYPMTATIYCAIGLAFTLLIAVRWRAHLWRLEAPANAR